MIEFKNSTGGTMDGQNRSDKKQQGHGLRLIKGGIDKTDQTANDLDVNASQLPKKRVKNPLITQLRAVTEAIENDVKMIMKL
jgi:hypothetical protein